MKQLRKNGGFTLVELMVSIAIGSLVTLAACSVLLLGMRLSSQSEQTVQKQTTTRIMLSMLENITAEGAIKEVKTEGSKWEIIGENNNVILSYVNENGDEKGYISTGSNNVMLENVKSSTVNLTSDGLLTFTLENEEGTYSTSTYCRAQVVETAELKIEELLVEAAKMLKDDPTQESRWLFLNALASQLESTGTIIVKENTDDTPETEAKPEEGAEPETGTETEPEPEPEDIYYSQWYAEARGINWGREQGWNANTPWCACYISWALSSMKDYVQNPPNRYDNESAVYYWYANVDEFKEVFVTQYSNVGKWQQRIVYTPLPGDLIFFDWDSGNDPEHVGVVLAVVDGNVYTIEGNTANTVAIRKYPVADTRIIGYGVLNWKSTVTE